MESEPGLQLLAGNVQLKAQELEAKLQRDTTQLGINVVVDLEFFYWFL